ncbi:MAG: IS66 family insertion sequence element accessory protein TnpB [Deltaproteobacteria bacterium]|jgi:transposase|nr:IS66 family insertion sequence element accessory protein TnpB [Deltaproteobacteria bacterium]
MIQLTPHMRIILAVEPADFRKGIDGLARICRSVLESDPFSGYLFVFMNKGKTAIKMLVYDGQGFWLFQKRLSSGRFLWWPNKKDNNSIRMLVHELQLLLWNGDPESTKTAPLWKKIPV